MPSPDEVASDRVLVLMPGRRDAERTVELLREGGVPSKACNDLAALCREFREGAGALLLTDEAVVTDTSGQLAETLRAQPAWSAVPVIVITRDGGSLELERNPTSGLAGLIIVERPVRTRTLLSVTLSALRGRRHQYQIRDALSLLARQAEQLRTADRRKDEFLATLAHELRNPLAPIQTGLDLLDTARDGTTADRAVGVMHRQLRHMVRLIDDLLDVSRITQGKFELKRTRVTLEEVFEAAVEASQPFIEHGNHTLRVTRSDPPLTFDADPTRLAQVVSNLLNNASKYTPSGGSIELSAEKLGDEGVITVRDNGIGIPRDQLDQVFEMFSQVNRTTDRAQGGLGIGLALVKTLVGLHGGSVSASSEGPGRGSVFTVRLPLAQGTNVTSVEATRGSGPPRHKQRILVVDDNEDAVELMTLLLENAGYETRQAHDGPQALAIAEGWQPTFAILDIGLPGMSGYDVARELRRQPELAEVVLIALSGWGSHEDERRSRDAGFDLHLTKPVDAERLYRVLASLEPPESPTSVAAAVV